MLSFSEPVLKNMPTAVSQFTLSLSVSRMPIIERDILAQAMRGFLS